MVPIIFAILLRVAVGDAITQPSATATSEDPVAPYAQANANAGATAFEGQAMWRAFHGREGVARIIDRLVDLVIVDRRISDIFKGQDLVRLRRVLKEQFCYLLDGGCQYTGRTMAESHKDLGIQSADMSALVEDLQQAMHEEHVAFPSQNRLLAKLAAMERTVVTR